MTGQTRVSVGRSIAAPFYPALRGCAESDPNADLRGDGNGRLSLATDTSGANFTRDAGNGGPIAVEWNRTADLSKKAAGSHQIYYGDTGYSCISNGSGQMYSARAQGSVVGHPISTSPWDAQTGENNSVGIEIDRGP